MKNSNSHNRVLILGAICISIVAGVLSYKIADIKNKGDGAVKSGGIFNITGDQEISDNDKLLSIIEESQTSSENNDPFTITGKDTATSRLAKQVYSDYVNQQAGNSDLTVSDVAQNALSQISSADMPRAKYGLKDLSLISQSSSEVIRLYGNNFAEIYSRNMSLIANNQAKYGKNLSAIADVYENISRELVSLKVPVEVSVPHLAVANNYKIISDSFRMIDQQSEDPVKSLLGIRSAKIAGEESDQMFINISKYFKSNGIIFDKSEIGRIWNSN